MILFFAEQNSFIFVCKAEYAAVSNCRALFLVRIKLIAFNAFRYIVFVRRQVKINLNLYFTQKKRCFAQYMLPLSRCALK